MPLRIRYEQGEQVIGEIVVEGLEGIIAAAIAAARDADNEPSVFETDVRVEPVPVPTKPKTKPVEPEPVIEQTPPSEAVLEQTPPPEPMPETTWRVECNKLLTTAGREKATTALQKLGFASPRDVPAEQRASVLAQLKASLS